MKELQNQVTEIAQEASVKEILQNEILKLVEETKQDKSSTEDVTHDSQKEGSKQWPNSLAHHDQRKCGMKTS